MRNVVNRLLILSLVWVLASCQPPAPDTVAITNVTVIDATNAVRTNQTVIFSKDKILTVQTASQTAPAGTTIDGTGKFLIPGLWDFHVHLSYDDRFAGRMSELFLSYGITSVRDTGGLMRKVLPIVETMRQDDAIAPRVFFSGPLLDGEYVVYDGKSRPEIGVQNTSPVEARSTVRSLARQGVDFIKIYEMVSPQVFAAMVETANELGLPIDAHVPLSMRARVAGSQVNSLEHLRNIEMDCASDAAILHGERVSLLQNPDELSGYALRSSMHQLQRDAAIDSYDETQCAETIAALSSTTMVPTLRLNALPLAAPYQREDWADALARVPQSVREDWSASGERMASAPPDGSFGRLGDWSLFLIGLMNTADVPIGAGTDTPIGLAVPGYSLHTELEMLVRAGLTPMEALESATLVPARFFAIDGEMGTIEAGMKADMVLLSANPLDNISNTRKISAVVSKGVVMDRKTLDELADP